MMKRRELDPTAKLTIAELRQYVNKDVANRIGESLSTLAPRFRISLERVLAQIAAGIPAEPRDLEFFQEAARRHAAIVADLGPKRESSNVVIVSDLTDKARERGRVIYATDSCSVRREDAWRYRCIQCGRLSNVGLTCRCHQCCFCSLHCLVSTKCHNCGQTLSAAAALAYEMSQNSDFPFAIAYSPLGTPLCAIPCHHALKFAYAIPSSVARQETSTRLNFLLVHHELVVSSLMKLAKTPIMPSHAHEGNGEA